MARTLPTQIQNALTSQTQQPAFQVTIQDLQVRFNTLATNALTNGRSDVLLSSTGTLIQAAVSGGALSVRRITDATQASQWSASYTTIAGAAPQNGAGCALVQTGGTTRLFYQNASNRIVYRDSSDDGQTWGAENTSLPAAPLGLGNICAGITADSINRVWAIYYSYANAASSLYRSSYAAGWSAWASEGPATPRWGQLRGLSCTAVSGTTYLVAGVQMTYGLKGISVASCSYSAGAYSSWSQIVPLDNPNLGLSLANPRLHYDGAAATYWLTVLYNDSGAVSGTAGTRLVVLTSTDFVAWTPWHELGQGFQAEAHALPVGGRAYVFDSTTTVNAPAGPSLTDVSDDVLSLRVREVTNQAATLSLVLANQSGQYNGHPSVRPDARITVGFGYASSVLTTHVFIIDGYTCLAGPGVQEIRIEARDAVKLLDYPQTRFLAYSGQTVGQLTTTICKNAGISLAALPTTAQFSQSVPCFVIAPGESWLHALDRVAAIYGFDYWADKTPQLRVQERQASDPSTWSYGTEVFGIAYSQSADQANVLRVVGQSSTTPPSPVFADVFDTANIMLVGKERFRNIVDRTLDTSAKCKIRGQLALREEQMNATGGELSVTINPKHEVLDVVQITDAGLGLTNLPLRIHAIDWHVEPERGVWLQKLILSGV